MTDRPNEIENEKFKPIVITANFGHPITDKE